MDSLISHILQLYSIQSTYLHMHQHADGILVGKLPNGWVSRY